MAPGVARGEKGIFRESRSLCGLLIRENGRGKPRMREDKPPLIVRSGSSIFEPIVSSDRKLARINGLYATKLLLAPSTEASNQKSSLVRLAKFQPSNSICLRYILSCMHAMALDVDTNETEQRRKKQKKGPTRRRQCEQCRSYVLSHPFRNPLYTRNVLFIS